MWSNSKNHYEKLKLDFVVGGLEKEENLAVIFFKIAVHMW